ncbi:MAG: replicative DNA helicase [Dehalococcoidia bacterium]|nr:replicative DNA helicase [Dehalococcoidia bacterium]
MYAERVPPHSLENEEYVVGSLLLDGETIARVADLLRPDDFFNQHTRRCFEACLALFQRGTVIDQGTVTDELARREWLQDAGGPAYLSSLIAGVPTSVHIEEYARIVARTALLRRLIRAASEIAAIGYEGPADSEAALNQAEDLLFKLRTNQGTRDFVPLREILDRFLGEMTNAEVSGPLGTGTAPIRTKMVQLDELLGGLQRSDLVILAARPSVGKSALALNMARNAAAEGASVGFFSLEMSKEQLALRLLAAETGIEGRQWARMRAGLYGQYEAERLIDAVGKLSELKLYMDDTPMLRVMEIRSRARRLAMQHGLDLLIVDYLQLISGPNARSDNRVQEISEISRSLKALARELNIPVLACSQLNRAVEMRTGHKPQLSDLRDSGSIEQDSDVVMFISREDMYVKPEEWEQMHPERPYPENIAEIIVAKHRHGPVGSVYLRFNNRLVRFEDAPSAPTAG